MSAIKWYKRDPDAALGGMMSLSLEECGAYNIILDLIYSRANNLPDDDRFLAGWMRVDVRVWRRIKMRLIELGKIAIEDGLVVNAKATSEIDEALGRLASVSELNQSKGRKSGAVRRQNKKLVEPKPEPKSNTTTTTTRVEDITTVISIDRDDNKTALKSWNTMASELGLPQVQVLTESRLNALRLRLAEIGGLAGWAVLMEMIRGSPHLLGENDRGWRASLDWILKPANLTKTMEGNYRGSNRKIHSTGTGPQRPNSIRDSIAIVRATLQKRVDDERGASAGVNGQGNSDAGGVSGFQQSDAGSGGRDYREVG